MRARNVSRCAISWCGSAAHGDAVRRAGGARACPPVAAAAELEAARIQLAPPRFRSQGACATIPIRRRWCRISRNIPGLHQEAAPRWAASHAKARAGDTDLVVPAGRAQRAYEASFARFASVFPDVFYVSERGRFFPDDSQDKGRLLSAGYHNVMGYWRDDTPLMELILDEKGRRNWTGSGTNSISSPITPPAPGFSITSTRAAKCRARALSPARVRPSDKEVSAEPSHLRTARRVSGEGRSDRQRSGCAGGHPRSLRAGQRHAPRVERMRVEAEPQHLDALLEFAARAYRRPLTQGGSATTCWRTTRAAREGRADARRCDPRFDRQRPDVARVLLPHRSVDDGAARSSRARSRLSGRPALRRDIRPGTRCSPLSDYALASRLSYFLWSSMPDEELLAHAAAGDLQKPEVLVAQARRMLKDERARGLAVGVRGQLARFPPLRETQRRRSRALPELHERSARGDVRGAGPVHRGCDPQRPFRARPALRQLHVRESGPGEALRHAGGRRATPTRGFAWTMRASTDAAVCCRWPCS